MLSSKTIFFIINVGLFRQATQLKTKFPGLKVLLGVGGDVQETPEKWLELLESSQSRIAFINSAYDIVKSYGFDGIDLAYEFPKIKPKKVNELSLNICKFYIVSYYR